VVAAVAVVVVMVSGNDEIMARTVLVRGALLRGLRGCTRTVVIEVPCTAILRVAVKHFGLSEAHVAVGR
jgi:hypothetical protein